MDAFLFNWGWREVLWDYISLWGETLSLCYFLSSSLSLLALDTGKIVAFKMRGGLLAIYEEDKDLCWSWDLADWVDDISEYVAS